MTVPAGPGPTRDEVLAVVRSAVVTVLEVDPALVSRSSAFVADLGADSLALVEIVEIVEEAMTLHARPGFRIEDEDLDGLATVGQAVDYVVARL